MTIQLKDLVEGTTYTFKTTEGTHKAKLSTMGYNPDANEDTLIIFPENHRLSYLELYPDEILEVTTI